MSEDVQKPTEGAAGEASPPEAKKRGRGRPPGARNKRTEAFLRLVEEQHGSTPAERLATIAFGEPVQISRQYGITIQQAFAFMIKALVELLPYCHQKLPTMIDVVNEQHIVLQLGQMGTGAQISDEGAGRTHIDMRPADVRLKDYTNQGLSDVDSEKSDIARSDKDS